MVRRKGTMNRLRFAWVVAALSLAASVTHAGTVPDPKILVAGSGYSQALYEPDFSFTANSTGGGSFDFYNASNIDWENLSISTAMPYGFIDDVWVALDSPTYYDVSSDLFTGSSLSFGSNSLTILFSGHDGGHPGIPSVIFIPRDKGDYESPKGSHFSVNLDNDGTPGLGGWLGEDGGPLVFNATANAVPEPGTIVLLLGGLLAMGLRSRRGK
jgi:hypothetical protein